MTNDASTPSAEASTEPAPATLFGINLAVIVAVLLGIVSTASGTA